MDKLPRFKSHLLTAEARYGTNTGTSVKKTARFGGLFVPTHRFAESSNRSYEKLPESATGTALTRAQSIVDRNGALECYLVEGYRWPFGASLS